MLRTKDEQRTVKLEQKHNSELMMNCVQSPHHNAKPDVGRSFYFFVQLYLQSSANLCSIKIYFIDLLNDNYLTSDLTSIFYKTNAKDEMAAEPDDDEN